MAPVSLTKILTLAPLLISSTFASVSDVYVNRNDKNHVVHAMYQALGENWALTDDDSSHRIQGIVMFDHKADYDAWHQSNNFSQHLAPRKAIRDLGRVFDRRAIVGHPTTRHASSKAATKTNTGATAPNSCTASRASAKRSTASTTKRSSSSA